MEEAVTRKFVHEDSSSVTSLCGAVESCLSQGLKRRALGLFKTSSTTALLHKIAKNFEPANIISQKVQELELVEPQKRSSSSTDNGSKPAKPPLHKNNSAGCVIGPKYLWIRLALFEKQLAKIIDHLVQNACKYYEKDSLVADPDYGSILSSLLVGPCALDYSKAKTQDYFWTDPPADELVQRHRISTGHNTPPTCRRQVLNFNRSLHAVNSEENVRSVPMSAKDYVESLHQNNRATLLYGKNNVMVLPKEHLEPMAGYLSLHQSSHGLTIKWTPNQLMNGYVETENQDKSLYWEYALNVSIDEIVYVHCHQASDSGGTIILVGQDGVQRPPIHFPKGGHLLSFLSCLENGLLPHGQLDPPLWSQRGKGKVLPKLRRKSKENSDGKTEDDDSTDYVFRIVRKVQREDIKLLDPRYVEPVQSVMPRLQSRVRAQLLSSSTSSTSSSKSFSADHSNGLDMLDSPKTPNGLATSPSQVNAGESIQLVCDTMKRQIISRAFYGWLAYCRHLSTVRTHLSGLVNPTTTSHVDADGGLTSEKWNNIFNDGIVSNSEEVFRLTYLGGVEHSLRKEVWPFLLGHYEFGSTIQQRVELDLTTQHNYETIMSDWLAVEAIVRQRDKETMAANLAKLSSESTSGENVPLTPGLNAQISNDVFEDNISLGSDDGNLGMEGIEFESEKKDNDDNLEKSIDTEEAQQNEVNTFIENVISQSSDEGLGDEDKRLKNMKRGINQVIVTNPSVDSGLISEETVEVSTMEPIVETETLTVGEEGEQNNSTSNCVSPASSQGGIYSAELLETFGLNVHRIDKDVQRCDRNYYYFTNENLEKLRNVMCTYVWEHLDIGYMQGMCDLVAPLLVIFDEESITYACFCRLMDRMVDNFPNGGAMDAHFANMRSLIQILDSEMFELMHQNGDYTHFYFCYRWFLLDFKREMIYDDVFIIWETIWAAKHIASAHFVLFIALALVEIYRDIILTNSMDFTDIIKFFNEMAERHDAKAILTLARELVFQVQTLIENK
ncbi:run and tbc1 domain-containing protein, putative [Pediculus humanus corporis]|nr:run and tbc1 domain-containing protein, putative [Pediculus humanus corporis]EEB20263.1 run and tbc1 domain-containing protein, putative [Pediculus humanus corporis]